MPRSTLDLGQHVEHLGQAVGEVLVLLVMAMLTNGSTAIDGTVSAAAVRSAGKVERRLGCSS
jgi:hypothetical protein